MPPARAHDERGQRPFKLVGFLTRLKPERAPHRLEEALLSADDVLPRRREGVLQVGHKDLRARVKRVDHHLGLGGAGDLDAAVV